MKIVCITLADYSNYGKRTATVGRQKAETEAHFQEKGVDASYYYGLHAEKLGLRTIHPYQLDAPGSGFNMGPGPTGCWLSHRTLWSALLLLPDDVFLILEDDAIFPSDWRDRLERNMRVLPDDWDVFYVASCCAENSWKTHVAEEVYEVRYPACLHGYMVRRKALMTMITTTDDSTCYAPIDIGLMIHTLPHLRTYTLLPRLLEQVDTAIPH